MSIPTTTTPSTTTHITTTETPCQDRNLTLYVTSDEEKAQVDITPDIQTELAVGRHVIHISDCTINIIVINNGGYKYK